MFTLAFVLGARVPILTSRADSLTARLASCAVAALIAKFRRDQAVVRPQ
jgi:phosphate acetyltransferase